MFIFQRHIWLNSPPQPNHKRHPYPSSRNLPCHTKFFTFICWALETSEINTSTFAPIKIINKTVKTNINPPLRQLRRQQSSKELSRAHYTIIILFATADCSMEWVSETVECECSREFFTRESYESRLSSSCAVRDAERVSGRGWLLLKFKHRLIILR